MSTVLASVWRRWTTDVEMPVAMPPRTAVTSTPRMATAMMSSTSESPASERRFNSDIDLVEDPVHGGDEGDGDEAHDEAHHHDHRRLEQIREPSKTMVELVVEVVGRHGE